VCNRDQDGVLRRLSARYVGAKGPLPPHDEGIAVNNDIVGHCPTCGRFCGGIVALISEVDGIRNVAGKCFVHGIVDLTNQPWSCDDFEEENE